MRFHFITIECICLFVLNQTLSNPGTIIMMSVTWIAWWGFEWVVFCLACRYSVVKRADNSEKFLVATERTASIAALLGSDLQTVGTFTGNTQCLKHHVTRCRRETSSSRNELLTKIIQVEFWGNEILLCIFPSASHQWTLPQSLRTWAELFLHLFSSPRLPAWRWDLQTSHDSWQTSAIAAS